MLPIKFRVHWPFGSGGEAQNRFFKMEDMADIFDFQSELL